MIIQNFNHSYQVMCHLGRTEKTEEFLCSEIRSGENIPCLLVCIKDSVLAKNVTLFLEEEVKGGEFTDYLECFQAEGAFYMAFCYSLWESLPERLNSEFCSLRERAEIAKKLLERLLLLNPHPYFAWNALKSDQITVNRSLEVAFNYHLEQMVQFGAYTMGKVVKRLSAVLRQLFAEEEKNHLHPLLDGYLNALEQWESWSYLKLYKEFMPVYEELLNKNTEKQVPQSFWFRLWNRVKKILVYLKKILAVALVAVTVLYVVKELGDDSGSRVVSQTMSQIGELMIESTETPKQQNGE